MERIPAGEGGQKAIRTQAARAYARAACDADGFIPANGWNLLFFLYLQHHRTPRGRAITTDFLEKAVTLSLQVKLSDPELVRQWFLSKGSLLLPEGHGSCRCGSRRRR